jgi:hypothetical protein
MITVADGTIMYERTLVGADQGIHERRQPDHEYLRENLTEAMHQ